MCKAKELSQKLLDLYHEVNNEFQSLYQELDQANLYEIDVLHTIENTNFNASEGYMYAKMLRDNRIKRRVIKNELHPLSQLKNNFIDKSYLELTKVHQEVIKKDDILTYITENKIYNPRAINNIPRQLTEIIREEVKVIPEPVLLNVCNSKKTRLKKTGEEIQVMSKVNSKQYMVKRKDGKVEVINAKNIIGLDKIVGQVAK